MITFLMMVALALGAIPGGTLENSERDAMIRAIQIQRSIAMADGCDARTITLESEHGLDLADEALAKGYLRGFDYIERDYETHTTHLIDKALDAGVPVVVRVNVPPKVLADYEMSLAKFDNCGGGVCGEWVELGMVIVGRAEADNGFWYMANNNLGWHPVGYIDRDVLARYTHEIITLQFSDECFRSSLPLVVSQGGPR